KAIGEKSHKSAAQVAWRWALQLGMPVVSKVSGQHVDEYMSLFDFQLTEKEMEQIQLINQKEQGQTCTGPWSNSVKPGANWG
ncbi:MAG: aldo/keto reductase, partial [Parachlamydiales bacterium]